ncbi:peptidoglycan binding protein CsiV [Vibrio sp. CAU 1672]|uniref:peptidoglycan binding protein CsiV n=1 Tax=Vibrio sp. CAU 1672 TaxID=3032594 RepID=UPI0023DA100D|nr:peptidoglycan binding protein CsiV [Vibrio sp. CAU 1672]MDF2153623.1 peptidoglycan binding protein CsiV [Vibrio sp. CAU 1672]
MRILIPLLLLCVSLPSWAQRQFDIEVIIFKRNVDAENTSESWPNHLPAIEMSNVGSLQSDAYLQSKEVTLLPASDYQLNAQKEKLDRHAGFEVLNHIAWRQDDRGRASAPVFRILGGHDYSDQYHADGSEKHGSTAAITDDGFVEQTIDAPLYELDGKLQIYVQHYLFAETTLDLRQPSVREVHIEDQTTTEPITLAEDQINVQEESDSTVQVGHLADIAPTVTEEKFLKSYRMEQKRRMRSGETHYLDNPLMGMIIQVRRVE